MNFSKKNYILNTEHIIRRIRPAAEQITDDLFNDVEIELLRARVDSHIPGAIDDFINEYEYIRGKMTSQLREDNFDFEQFNKDLEDLVNRLKDDQESQAK
ncbi:MAG: hypothetical protein NC122_06155 [Faecalibacterium sp.]|nr:hypothetical protein [Ruminococcus sp.]MCM1392571.1 hypothetical protein [Ruminococcus sp.]MCM1485773.1 hypothetical protein [Faecalibacterium sp.]